MNRRMMSIILDLNKADDKLTIDELSKRGEVSQRTIRNDIHAINSLLEEHGLNKLVLKSGGFIEKSEDFSKIMEHIDSSNFYTYKLSQEERIKVAATLLINSSGYVTMSTIADNLFVSRETIINDLDEIKDFINRGNLNVVSRPNKGLKVEGTEENKRKFLMRLVDMFSPDEATGVLVGGTSVLAGNQMIIKKIVSEQEHNHKRFLTDESYQGVVQYLGIMLARILHGEYIEAQSKKTNESYPMAVDILKYISQYCNAVITEDEVLYFNRFLSRVRHIKKEPADNEFIKIQMITRNFIELVSEEISINLSSDYEFYEKLSGHMATILSDVSPLYKANDLITEVLESNQDILSAVKKYMYIFEPYARHKLSEIEISYVAVHVCAALERKKNKEVAFHVIVACNAGIGTSQLLMERLKKHFNFQIVDIISTHEARNIDPAMADFVISTIQLKACPVEYVVVSPFLTDEDYLRIGNKIDTIRNSKHLPSRITDIKLSANGLMNEIEPVIKEFKLDVEAQLIKQIKKAVRRYFRQPIESEAQIVSPYLHNFLTADHIQLDVECSDWEDAVKKSALPLLKDGYIEERYIDAMIQNIKENGTYIVISKGFAIPHEGLEAGSIQTGMNLIRLKKPVEFGAEERDPVEFVCCLSAVDHKMHLKAFFNLVNLLKNEEFKAGLRNSRTPQEASILIEKMEYSLE